MRNRFGIDAYCDQYFTATPEGVRLRDIVTGDSIRPLLPASSVLKDECLNQDMEYLHYLREKDIRVDLVLGLHGSAERFADISGQADQALLESRAVGIEMRWQSTASKPTLETVTLLPARAGGLANFHKAELDYLQLADKAVLPCDSREDSKLSIAISQAWRLVGLESHSNLDEKIRNRVRLVAYAAIQATRHWAMLGQFGYWLSTIDNRLKPGHSVALIEGIEHAPDEQRLREYFGLNVTSHVTHHRNPPMGRVALDKSILLNGFITNSKIDIPLHF